METRSDWIKSLSAQSRTIAGIAQGAALPEVLYRDPVSREITEIDAYNFSNDPEHNQAFARCFDGLASKGTDAKALGKSLTDLTNGGTNTYGAICELLTYVWLLDRNFPFEIQVPVTDSEVLNPNGSELDGRLTDLSPGTFFDVKGFGFQVALVERLKKRLEKDIPDTWIAVEGSWDVSVKTMQELLSREYGQLVSELKQTQRISRGVLQFIKRDKKRLQISPHRMNPYQLASENAGYMFKFAKQFCRKEPFILFLAHHPWVGGLSLNSNFAKYASDFTRALSRRTFIQFLNDTSACFDVTKAEASKLLSAIAFLNISKIPAEPGKAIPQLRLYLNPNALNPIPQMTIELLTWEVPHSVFCDDFSCDNY